MEISGVHFHTVLGIKVLCVVVGQVFLAGCHYISNSPKMTWSVIQKNKSHFCWSWLLLLYCIIYNACCCDIVTMHWCWWLLVSNFMQSIVTNLAFFCIEEQCPKLGFCWRCNHIFLIPQKSYTVSFILIGSPFTAFGPSMKSPATLLLALESDK